MRFLAGDIRWLADVLRWARHKEPTVWAPINLAIARRDLSMRPDAQVKHAAEVSLDVALDLILGWLERACKAGKPGIANGYSLWTGWQGPHVETTGYTIATLCDVASHRGKPEWLQRAETAAGWVLAQQAEGGAFRTFHPRHGRTARVFDTAQALQGLLRLHTATNDQRYLAAAERAGDWIVAQQDDDGAWRRGAYNAIPHTYYTRAAHPLLELSQAVGHQRFAIAARKNLDWALAQVDSDGYPRHCGFTLSGPAFTHTIAYTMEGFLRGALLTGDERYLRAALGISTGLLHSWNARAQMPGHFRPGWIGEDSYSCMTGNAQVAMCWLLLGAHLGRSQETTAAHRLLRTVAAAVPRRSLNPSLIGGIMGSCPIQGQYLPYFFPLWAAKFAVDALLQV